MTLIVTYTNLEKESDVVIILRRQVLKKHPSKCRKILGVFFMCDYGVKKTIFRDFVNCFVSADCAVIAYGYGNVDDAEEAFLHCETVLSGFR